MNDRAPIARKTVTNFLKVTPELLKRAEEIETEGTTILQASPAGQKVFIQKFQIVMAELSSLIDDLKKYPHEAEVGNAYDKVYAEYIRLESLHTLMAKMAVEERQSIPDNRLN